MSRPSRQQIAEAITGLIADGVEAEELARSIAAYLITERRAKEVESLMRDLIERRKELGLIEIDAVSAFPLAENVKKHIEQIMAGRRYGEARVIINESTNPKVIGGVELESATTRLDLTFKSRLERLKQLTNLTN